MTDQPLSPAEKRRALEFIGYRQKFARWHFFKPYPKQQAFFDLGATKRERLFMAGTQVGKSESGAYEATCHLTGMYPPTWRGRRFSQPIRMWAAGVTSLDVRNVQQRKLCGPPGVASEQGTGLIPKDMLLDWSLARGVTDAYDQIQVRHVTGGISILQFKSYEQGRAKFQGDTINVGWADEEPEKMEIYDEFLSRLTGDGILYTTFTPLFGPTELVNSFTNEDHPDRGVVRMELKEAEHFTAEEKERRLAGYKRHERDAREKGIPKLGSGAIFITPEDMIVEDAIEHVPAHWAKIWGVDFGIGHPFAAVLLLHDRDGDVIHVHHTIRMSDALSIVQAQRMKDVAAGVPVAWPADGTHRDKNYGEPLALGYKKHGLHMLGEHAHFADGSVSTEAAIHEIDEREKTGKLRVAKHLTEWLEERRFYHRKDGQVVKLRDDLMAATQKAVMMKRYARSTPLGSANVSRETSVLAANVDFDLFAPLS